MTAKKAGAAIDPITLSVVWNKLLSITLETGERIIHSAQSYVMGNARDLGIVLLDDEMRIITQQAFLPCHCLSAGIATQAMTDALGKLEPGDMALSNDGFIVKSGHLPDWVIITPIYWHDELVMYCHFRGHQGDAGGAYSGSYFPKAYDCIAEGLNIPPIKIIEKGKVDEKVTRLIYNNIRTPAAGWADVMLCYGSFRKAEKDVCDLIEKYGLDTFKACCEEMLRRGEEAMRAEIRSMPDGVYYGEQAVDWDGTKRGVPVWIRVKMTKKGDEITFDLSDSADQVDFVNSPLGNTYSYVFLALFLAVDPTVPHNDGAMRPVHLIAPAGKVVNPTRPHTYGACGCHSGCEIYATCAEALGKAAPDKTQAPFSYHFAVNITGRLPITDPRTGYDLEYFANPFIEEGGSGAVKGFDGWEGIVGCPLVGTVYRGSVEINELLYPYRYHVAKLAQDSEGPGEFIGSRGVYAEKECTAPPGAQSLLMSGASNGQYFPPPGIAGAPPASRGELYIKRAGKKEREMFYTMDQTEMHTGDILITKASGGPGWGNPLNRDVEKVKADVISGLFSVQHAKDVYGVIVRPESVGENPETIEIDYKATEELRKQLKA